MTKTPQALATEIANIVAGLDGAADALDALDSLDAIASAATARLFARLFGAHAGTPTIAAGRLERMSAKAAIDVAADSFTNALNMSFSADDDMTELEELLLAADAPIMALCERLSRLTTPRRAARRPVAVRELVAA